MVKGLELFSKSSEKARDANEKPQYLVEVSNTEDKVLDIETPKDNEGSYIDTRYGNKAKKYEDETELISGIDKSTENKWTTGFFGALFSTIYFLTCAAALIFVMNFVHIRMPREAPILPDLGHEWIPKLEPEDRGDYPMFCLIGGFVVTLIFHPSRFQILIKFFCPLGHLYLLRIVSIAVTSLPATDNHCRTDYQEIPDIYANTIKGLLSLGGANIHCGDLMFSGHTCMVTIIWLTFMNNFPRRHIIKFIATLCMILTPPLIIATRSHYSADVWIAFWLSFFAYKMHPASFPFTPKKISKFIQNLF